MIHHSQGMVRLHLRSQAGRPGPNVAGVFPPATGGFFILLGITPLILGVALVVG